MSKSFKAILLVIILVVPALIFVFLRLFGDNQYDLPVYFQNGVDTTFADCEFQQSLHLVPDFSIPDYTGREINTDHLAGAFLVVYFTQDIASPVSHRVNTALSRVQGSVGYLGKIRILTIQPKKKSQPAGQLQEMAGKYGAWENMWYIGYANPVYTNLLARCGFVIDFDAMSGDVNNIIALVDEKRRIRGYFNGIDDGEVERLIVELKILNSNRK